jgi:hypothetical protein
MDAAQPSPDFAPWAAAETLGLTAPELAAFHHEPPQIASGTVGKTGFEQHVVGHHHRGATVGLQQRLDVLDEGRAGHRVAFKRSGCLAARCACTSARSAFACPMHSATAALVIGWPV